MAAKIIPFPTYYGSFDEDWDLDQRPCPSCGASMPGQRDRACEACLAAPTMHAVCPLCSDSFTYVEGQFLTPRELRLQMRLCEPCGVQF